MPATLIGLDIGSTSIRAVETRHGKDGSVLGESGLVPLPRGAVHGGTIHDDKAVTAAIKQLWSVVRFGSRNVVLGVTNPQVVVREMRLSNLPAKELRKSLPFQVGDALPLPVERSLLDFHPLDPPAADGTVRGLLIASPKEAVLTAVRASERAGLHVSRVDIASFALLRAASWLDTNIEALIDIGATVTTVVVHTDGVPLIVRTIPRGGAEITDTIASRLGISLPEAEAVKCRVGLNQADGPQVAELVREAIRPLASEIRSSFAYLTTGDRQARVDRVVLSGGGSQLPGLLDALSAQLQVAVTLADPTLRLRPSSAQHLSALDRFRPSAAVSIGLSLGTS